LQVFLKGVGAHPRKGPGCLFVRIREAPPCGQRCGA
jgi:hypothetical protein